MDELVSTLNEFKTDYNQTHFVRNASFKAAADSIQGPARKIFIEFLERSCTAEFSGFLLYKELGRRLKKSNPAVAEVFTLMSRDEARHAGFLNKAMSDFNLALDLGFLTKNRKYTFFKVRRLFVFLELFFSCLFFVLFSRPWGQARACRLLRLRWCERPERKKKRRRSFSFSFLSSTPLSLSFLPSFRSLSLSLSLSLPPLHQPNSTRTAQVHHLRHLPFGEDRLLALHLHLPPPAAQPQPRHLPALRGL